MNPTIIEKIVTTKIQVEFNRDSQFTKGMCVVDARRWKLKNSEQSVSVFDQEFLSLLANTNGKIPSVKENGPDLIQVIMKVDTDKFFETFMKQLFKIDWDTNIHTWTPNK